MTLKNQEQANGGSSRNVNEDLLRDSMFQNVKDHQTTHDHMTLFLFPKHEVP